MTTYSTEEQQAMGNNADNLPEEVCHFAKFQIQNYADGELFTLCKTNAQEDDLVSELALDIQIFVNNWMEKRIAVEKGG